MKDDEKKDDKTRTFQTISGGKKTTDKTKKPSSNGRSQIYVSDDRFKQAMDMIRNDMNKAFNLGNLINTQHYFLVKYLVKKGIIDENDLNNFIKNELANLQNKGDDDKK